METLAAINRWLAKQHVVTWCVCKDEEMWCANAFYYYDPGRVAFYVMSEDKTRRFPVAAALKAPVWEIRLDELKFTDNTLGFGKKLHWLRAEQA